MHTWGIGCPPPERHPHVRPARPERRSGEEGETGEMNGFQEKTQPSVQCTRDAGVAAPAPAATSMEDEKRTEQGEQHSGCCTGFSCPKTYTDSISSASVISLLCSACQADGSFAKLRYGSSQPRVLYPPPCGSIAPGTPPSNARGTGVRDLRKSRAKGEGGPPSVPDPTVRIHTNY